MKYKCLKAERDQGWTHITIVDTSLKGEMTKEGATIAQLNSRKKEMYGDDWYMDIFNKPDGLRSGRRVEFKGLLSVPEVKKAALEILTQEVEAPRIEFSPVKNFGFGREFDILLNGKVIGSASKADDYPECVYCTTGLELESGYLSFEHEFDRHPNKAKKEIRDYLAQALAGSPY